MRHSVEFLVASGSAARAETPRETTAPSTQHLGKRALLATARDGRRAATLASAIDERHANSTPHRPTRTRAPFQVSLYSFSNLRRSSATRESAA